MHLVVSLMFYLENGFGIEKPTKVDMPLNKKPNQTKPTFY